MENKEHKVRDILFTNFVLVPFASIVSLVLALAFFWVLGTLFGPLSTPSVDPEMYESMDRKWEKKNEEGAIPSYYDWD